MTIQDIKRGHFKNVEGDGLRNLLDEHFGTQVKVDDDGWHCVDYGALKPLRVRVLSRTELEVLTASDPEVATEVASDTIGRYNRFLQAATGFSAKERSKRLQKKAKEDKI